MIEMKIIMYYLNNVNQNYSQNIIIQIMFNIYLIVYLIKHVIVMMMELMNLNKKLFYLKNMSSIGIL